MHQTIDNNIPYFNIKVLPNYLLQIDTNIFELDINTVDKNPAIELVELNHLENDRNIKFFINEDYTIPYPYLYIANCDGNYRLRNFFDNQDSLDSISVFFEYNNSKCELVLHKSEFNDIFTVTSILPHNCSINIPLSVQPIISFNRNLKNVPNNITSLNFWIEPI